jgi:hypothetical protein
MRLVACVLLVCGSPAFGQAMVEAAGAASAASGSAGALKAVSDTVNATLGNLDSTLKAPSATTVVHTDSDAKTGKAAAYQKPPAAKPVYEDPQQIQAGIASDELTRRFGPPALSWIDDDGFTKLTYLTKAGAIQLELAAGKIVSVKKP